MADMNTLRIKLARQRLHHHSQGTFAGSEGGEIGFAPQRAAGTGE
jgi:hypothetical protein